MKTKRFESFLACAAVAALLAGVMASGCATGGQTGALAGTGVGALIGQTIGRNTAGTLIGAAAGAGVGYLIGNQIDKDKAKELSQKGSHNETGSLGGTKWKAVEVTPAPKPPFESYFITFTPDGWLDSTEIFADGGRKTDRERYRVVGDTLIINKPGYLVNAKYTLKGDRLAIDSQGVKWVFKRVGG